MLDDYNIWKSLILVKSIMFASISLAVAVVAIVVAIAAVATIWKRKKTPQTAETNYRAFFIMGLILMPMGFSWIVISLLTELDLTTGLPFFTLGVVYLAISLTNKDKWKKENRALIRVGKD